jgi:hypothetical protein
MDAMIALFVTQVIDSSTYWSKLGIGYWALDFLQKLGKGKGVKGKQERDRINISL